MSPLLPLHASKRRPEPLKPEDYDHEIDLIDHTRPLSSPVHTRSRSQSAGDRPRSREVSTSSSRRHSDVPLRKHNTPHVLREEIARRKYGKFKDHRHDPETDGAQTEGESEVDAEHTAGTEEERGRKPVKKPEDDPVIDILYENQRGGFLCGMALFSSRALGNLDPAPWTNSANKTSATNITNAQVPDPSWEWIWKEWKVNHTDEVDEDGWEYSFMFAKTFSWHGPTWWNSFVRRRAWIRKRAKRHSGGYKANQAHMLNSDYFTIYPVVDRSRSPASTEPESMTNRYSVTSLARREMEEDSVMEDITNIDALMRALKGARIDREKMEAVESFIEHGGDDLYYLQHHMHEIMRMFIFQASRRMLLSHLLKVSNEASDQRQHSIAEGESMGETQQRRLTNLEAAVSHADEEVKRLEYWSDVKDMAENGETKGAMDEDQGWNSQWTGIDDSGPKSVLSDRELPVTENCKTGEGNRTIIHHNHESEREKGKGIAAE
jgi:hypothetical protein